jgi:mevalonate kinase
MPRRGLKAVSASASGKAIIVGEHAVVYGARAVAMPVHNLQMSVRLTPTGLVGRQGAPQIRVFLGGRTVTDHLRGVVDDAFTALGIEPFSLDLEGNSTVLIGAGLGSSASLCIVVLKALADATGLAVDRSQLAAFGNQLERRFHGNPSGLDTAVVAMGQVIGFAKGQTPAELPVTAAAGRQWRFALLDSGARSSTLAMIQAAAPYFQGRDSARRLAAFDAAADDAAAGLAAGSREQVADAMSRTGAWLAEAGIVNAPLHDLVTAARSAGCLAAKPTGAGGGGCVLALLGAGGADRQLARLKELLGATRVFGVDLP